MGPGGFVPTNPDLADMLGRTDLDFEPLFFGFVWIPNFQISRFQISKFPEIWLGPGLGRAWAVGWVGRPLGGPGGSSGGLPGPLGWAGESLGGPGGPSGGQVPRMGVSFG